MAPAEGMRVCTARDCKRKGQAQPSYEFLPGSYHGGYTATCRTCRMEARERNQRARARRARETERRAGRKASRQRLDVLKLRNLLRSMRRQLLLERNARAALGREVERLKMRQGVRRG